MNPQQQETNKEQTKSDSSRYSEKEHAMTASQNVLLSTDFSVLADMNAILGLPWKLPALIKVEPLGLLTALLIRRPKPS
jgi:hypothetical protein